MIELVIASCEVGAERSAAADIVRRATGGAAVSLGEYGKPFFPELPELFHNVSHCPGYAAVAFADRAVGVDAEILSRFERMANRERFAKRMFAASKLSDTEPLTLLTAWTRMEAYLKLLGTGFRSAPAAINLNALPEVRFEQAYFDGKAMCSVAFFI